VITEAITLTLERDQISPMMRSVIFGSLLPIVVSFLSHFEARYQVKQRIAGVLALVSTLIGAVSGHTVNFDYQAISGTILAYLTSQVAYDKFWKLINLKERHWTLPGFGFGAPPIKVMDTEAPAKWTP
jgi:hypothetical protein